MQRTIGEQDGKVDEQILTTLLEMLLISFGAAVPQNLHNSREDPLS